MEIAEAPTAMSLAEAAERLYVSQRTLVRLIAEKKLHAVKVGHQWRVSYAELDRVLAEGAER